MDWSPPCSPFVLFLVCSTTVDIAVRSSASHARRKRLPLQPRRTRCVSVMPVSPNSRTFGSPPPPLPSPSPHVTSDFKTTTHAIFVSTPLLVKFYLLSPFLWHRSNRRFLRWLIDWINNCLISPVLHDGIGCRIVRESDARKRYAVLC